MASVIGNAKDSICLLVTLTLRSSNEGVVSIFQQIYPYFAIQTETLKTICSYNSQETITQEDDTLVVEIGDYGMSIMKFNFNSNKLISLHMFEFEKKDDLLLNLQLNESILTSKGQKLEKVFIYYNFRESILVPSKFYNKDNNSSILDLMFGQAEDYVLVQDHIESRNNYNIYRVPEQIHHWFLLHFPQCKFKHSSSNQTAEIIEETVIRCIVCYGAMKIIFSNQRQIQLVQHYQYTSPEDALYYLLRICETHGVKPSAVKIQLNGLLTIDSSLYDLIYNYFTDIEFYSSPVGDFELENGDEIPTHYFSHLLALGI